MDKLILEPFFSGLSTGLETVKSIESEFRREFDRSIAYRFNFFDYISTNELALSRIIAGLLDPGQTHGQGNLFLDELIKLISADGKSQRTLPLNLSKLENPYVSVETEKSIKNDRRIDVYIEISTDGNKFCLAIENKPYGKDEENQIKDYLEYLKKNFVNNFLLIYLPGDGTPPDNHSVDLKYLQCIGRDRFAILPYTEFQDETGDYTEYKVGYSLVEWLACCRKLCEAERIRFLLCDFENFCQKQFGDQAMTTDQKEFIKNYLKDNPKYLEYALAVSDAWPEFQAGVCKDFFNNLKDRIENLDILNQHQFEEKFYAKAKGSEIGIYLNPPAGEDEYCWIGFAADKPGPDSWWLGVNFCISDTDIGSRIKKKMSSLFFNLKGSAYSAYYRIEDRMEDLQKNSEVSMGDWSRLVPKLFHENQNKEGDILNFYEQEFNGFVEKALPEINKIWSEYINSK